MVVSVMDATGLKSIWKLLAFEELDLSKEVEKKVKKITAEEIVVIINAKKTLVDLIEKLLCLSISLSLTLSVTEMDFSEETLCEFENAMQCEEKTVVESRKRFGKGMIMTFLQTLS